MTDEAVLAWIGKGQAISLFLVALGVAGEFIGDMWARPIHRRIEFAHELEMSQQRERTANAERALAEIQESRKPRTIDTAASVAILSVLKEHVPIEPIEIKYIGGSVNEPGPFARSIAALLREAKWTVASVEGGPFIGTPPTGLLIRVSKEGERPERAVLLERALTAGNLSPRIVVAEPIKPGEVELLVGLKP